MIHIYTTGLYLSESESFVFCRDRLSWRVLDDIICKSDNGGIHVGWLSGVSSHGVSLVGYFYTVDYSGLLGRNKFGYIPSFELGL